jgi:glycerol-1-phosphate dehydrogenase [NAD(P)+]
MGAEVAAQCFAEIQPKIFDEKGAAELNAKLEALWPELRQELLAFIIPIDEMNRLLAAAEGPMTGRDLGLPSEFYREAVVHCREMRNRYSFLDLAADAGILEDFAAGEV